MPLEASVLAVLIVAGLVLVLVAVALLIGERRSTRDTGKKDDDRGAQHAQQQEAMGADARRGRRTGVGRMRLRPNRGGRATGAEIEGEGEARGRGLRERVAPAAAQADVEEEEEEGMEEGETAGLSKKERRRREKEAKRQAEEAAREAKEERRTAYSTAQQRKEAEREAAEQRRVEEEGEAQAAQEAEAAAELDKWKGMFSVETEGTVEGDAAEESQGLLGEFVDYIQAHKCVVLEDLASEFGLRAQDAVNRVVALEQMGRISGVMDDRGKFIFISLDEMKRVAEFIRSRGRISIAALAARSNELIDLEPKAKVGNREEGDLEWVESSTAPTQWDSAAGKGMLEAAVA